MSVMVGAGRCETRQAPGSRNVNADARTPPMSQITSNQAPADESADPADAGELTYVVSEMTCAHCKATVTDALVRVPGVKAVGVDLDTKLVRVRGAGLDAVAVRGAIEEAGYAAVAA
jgi:copper chaperone